MGSNINDIAGGGHKDMVFESKNIITKTKAGQKKEYFVKTKGKTNSRKFSEWFAKNKKKLFATICIIALVAVVALVILKIIIANQPQPKTTEELNAEITEIYNEIEEKLNSSTADAPYTDTVKYYQQMYESETDQNRKFEITIALGEFLQSNEMYDEAIAIYSGIDESSLSEDQLKLLYRELKNNYIIQENDYMATYYNDLLISISGEEPSE